MSERIKEDPQILCTAVKDGNLKIVEDLLKDGADVNTIDSTYDIGDMTLLHSAVRVGHVEMAKLLLNYGANVNLEDSDGITPIVAAIESRNTEMKQLLFIDGASRKDIPTILSTAVVFDYLEVVEHHLKDKADLNMIDSKGYLGVSVLHNAAACGLVEMAELLIKYRANVNAKDDNGTTPIDYAIRTGNIEMIDLLLTNGADINEDLKGLCKDGDNELNALCPTTNLLKQHIAKLKAAGLYVSEKNLLWISNDNEINNFLKKCEAEIEIMKIKKIGNSCAFFYNIFTKHRSKLAKNENIVQALKSDDYKKRFPIYASMIDNRFRREVEREELLEQVRNKFLPYLFESLNELPLLCTEKIFSYLSNTDLRILLVAC